MQAELAHRPATGSARTARRGSPHPQPLSAASALRRLSSAQARWADAVAGGIELHQHLSVERIGEAVSHHATLSLRAADPRRWGESELWPCIHVLVSGRAMPLLLSPHAQWGELESPAFPELPALLQRAIAAHVTQSMRQCLGAALHAAGIVGQPGVAALFDGDPPAREESTGAGLMLALAIDLGRADEQWFALLALPADAPPPARTERPMRARFAPTLPAELLVAQARIAASDRLAALRPGNVLLLDRMSDSESEGSDKDLRARLLLAGAALAEVSIAGWQPPRIGTAVAGSDVARTATLRRWLGNAERQLHNDTHAAPRAARSHPMSQEASGAGVQSALADATARVEAVVELPPVRIAELQSWVTGTVLPTAAFVDGTQVLLKVAGVTVGRGRLVAVDAMLGFELAELFD